MPEFGELSPRDLQRIARPDPTPSAAEQVLKREMPLGQSIDTQIAESSEQNSVHPARRMIDRVMRREPEVPIGPSRVFEPIFTDIDKLIKQNHDWTKRNGLDLGPKAQRKAYQDLNEQLSASIPDPEDQTRVMEAARDFMIPVVEGLKTAHHLDWDLEHAYHFVKYFPHRMKESLGDAMTPENIIDSLDIGSRSLRQVFAFNEKRPDYGVAYSAGRVCRLVQENIPQIIRAAGDNRDTIVNQLRAAADNPDHFDFEKRLSTLAASSSIKGGETLQLAALNMQERLTQIDQEIAENQFGSEQMKVAVDTANLIHQRNPDISSEDALSILTQELGSHLQRVMGQDRMAGHIFLGRTPRVILRGLTQLVHERLTADEIKQRVRDISTISADLIIHLNAGRTGRKKTDPSREITTSDEAWADLAEGRRAEDEREDWKHIGGALEKGVVDRILTLSALTQNQVPIQEFISWFRSSRSPIEGELDRMNALFDYSSAIADVATVQGLSPEQTGALVTKTARALQEFPWLIEERRFDIRKSLLRHQTLTAEELSEAVIAAQEGMQILWDAPTRNQEVDHEDIRHERRVNQLIRGFAFAMDVPLLRERVLRSFSRDAEQAAQMVRGLALAEDVYKGNEYFFTNELRDETRVQMNNLLQRFPDTQNIDTFLNGLVLFMDRYDQGQNRGEWKLHKEALDFTLHSENPTETLIRMLRGDASAVKAVGWFNRLTGDSVVSFAPREGAAIGMLTAPHSPDTESHALVPSQTGNALTVQLAESATPLGIALQTYGTTYPIEARATQALREKIKSLELRTVEDVQAFLPLVIPAMAQFFGVPLERLQSHQVGVESAQKYIDKIREQSPLAGGILDISAIIGGGEVPPIAYGPKSNTIIINENAPRGVDIGALGEEVAHWVRELARNQEEDSDSSVHEFFGYIGQRVIYRALGLPDTRTDPKASEGNLTELRNRIIERSIFPSMIDTGFEAQLRNQYQHTIGYTAGSNIKLDALPANLISADEATIREQYLKRYGPSDRWFEQEEGRIRKLARSADNRDIQIMLDILRGVKP